MRELHEMYERMLAHYGPTHWWPGETPFEVAIGAILTQNTAWTNVERAIGNLRRENLLEPAALAACPDLTLQDAIRPSGYFRTKARYVRDFARHLLDHYGGSMDAMAERPLEELRPELLALRGIGPETADDILLYACGKPVFVVDAYTRRILSRHGLCDPAIRYEPLRALFETALAADLTVFREFHGLIVFTGKDFCRRAPRCAGCPLEPMLKPGQPLL